MTNTPNYNLLLAEGTDLVNYLTQTNPNFSNLDTIIKGISDLTVTPATEVTTGTAHAISKSLPDATVIKFTATSNWLTGDTMTLDGNPVTPLKTDGTTLKTGDYIIGSAVLMIQDGTRLTVLVASSPDAGDINYDNSVSGLASNKVQGAIDENAAAINTINSNLTYREIVSVNHSTYSSNITALYNGFSTLTAEQKKDCYILEGATKHRIQIFDGRFSSTTLLSSGVTRINAINLPGNQYVQVSIATNGNVTRADITNDPSSDRFILMARG